VGGRVAETEVVVVGGGPAGLATALELRQRDIDVVVVETSTPPVDKACGEGIMPDGVARLVSMGVALDERQCGRIRGIRYLDGERIAEATFPSHPALGVRRTVLHAAMCERAAEAGAVLVWGERALGFSARGVVTARGEISADWIVGADGLNSAVRRWSGLERASRRHPRFGVRRHFLVEPWSDLVEVYWGERCEAYVTPVGPDEVGVALLWSGEKAKFQELLERHPSLMTRLEGAEPSSPARGKGPLQRQVAGVTKGRVALVGDAAGYRDAITGEGLSLAFHQAAALAEAIEGGDLVAFERRVARLAALPNALIAALLHVERRPAVRCRLIDTLAANPALFARLLAIHVREQPVRSLGIGGVLKLAAGLLPSATA
jgi:flavin-dependent dehydrogenase